MAYMAQYTHICACVLNKKKHQNLIFPTTKGLVNARMKLAGLGMDDEGWMDGWLIVIITGICFGDVND